MLRPFCRGLMNFSVSSWSTSNEVIDVATFADRLPHGVLIHVVNLLRGYWCCDALRPQRHLPWSTSYEVIGVATAAP